MKKLTTNLFFLIFITNVNAEIFISEDFITMDKLGSWQTYNVNILEDYRNIYGSDPPKIASLAIMGDSDNTGEKSLAFIDFIKLESE